jgi:hypothetical protein
LSRPARRGALALAAALALLAGCKREPARPAPPAQPLSFERTTADATVKLTLAAGFADYPELRKTLYDEGVRQLQGFVASAAQDRSKLAEKRLPVPAYERTVAWTLTARNEELVSARKDWFEYTGGAHPNHGSDGLIWDVRQGRQVAPGELFRDDAPRGPLDQALCDAIRAAKTARQGALPPGPGFECPRWDDGDMVLEPSTEKGKFGGVTFLYDPYAIGPYVEGDYAVTIPQARFRSALSPTYASQFGGAPAPEPAAPAAGGR